MACCWIRHRDNYLSWPEGLVAVRYVSWWQHDNSSQPVHEHVSCYWRIRNSLSYFHFVSWRRGLPRAMVSSFLRFLNHIQRRTTVGRTLWTSDQFVAETSYPTTGNIYNRQATMPPAGFENTNPASEQPQTHALDRAATGTGCLFFICLYQITCSINWCNWGCVCSLRRNITLLTRLFYANFICCLTVTKRDVTKGFCLVIGKNISLRLAREALFLCTELFEISHFVLSCFLLCSLRLVLNVWLVTSTIDPPAFYYGWPLWMFHLQLNLAVHM